MLDLKPKELQFWEKYLATLPPESRPLDPEVSASVAGDERNADELLALYLAGKKTAGSSLLEDYVAAGDPLPRVGTYWMILDSAGRPKCIVRTKAVVQNRFLEVGEDIARAEGEGDLSLEYWRKTHIQFFEPDLAKWGLRQIEDATVVTEFFEVVFK